MVLGGAFFTAESKSSVLEHYNYAWPAIMHAVSLWLSLVEFEEEDEEDNDEQQDQEREKSLHLVMGELF